MTLLRTERLTIRPLRTADLGEVVVYRNDPQVSHYQAWPVPFTFDAATSLVTPHPLGSAGWVHRAIEREGRVIGDLGLRTDHPMGEISISLTRATQGHGYAREALTSLFDHAFGALHLTHVAADTHPENQPVLRMLERLGFLEASVTSGRYRHREWVLYSDVWAVM